MLPLSDERSIAFVPDGSTRKISRSRSEVCVIFNVTITISVAARVAPPLPDKVIDELADVVLLLSGIAMFTFPEFPEYVFITLPPLLLEVKVTLAPSQMAVLGEAVSVTVGVGLTVMVCIAVEGAPHPVAVAVTWIVPVNVGAKVTCPVTALILLPAAWLAASRLNVKVNAFVTEAV